MRKRAVLLFVATSACVEVQPTLDSPQHTASIFAGTAAPLDTAVVSLVDAWGLTCSGTLIAPSYVLTAAHCLLEVLDPTLLAVSFGAESNNGERIHVLRSAIHPTYWYMGEPDLAVVELESTAPAEIQPIALLQAEQALSAADVGATVRFIGFGDTEQGTSGARLTVEGVIDTVCDATRCKHPRFGTLEPHSILYTQDNGGPCFGDSGGPALIRRDGIEKLAAVTSRGDQRCTLYGVSTRVDAFADFFTPVLAGTPMPRPVCSTTACETGAACTTDDDCLGFGFCKKASYDTVFPGGYCSALCDKDDDCPGDALCDDGKCLRTCSQDVDCRPGYLCYADGTCYPAQLGGQGDVAVGGACDDVSACNAALCNPNYPGGMCTGRCEEDASCGAGVCVDSGCYASCRADSDCRANFVCTQVPEERGTGFCFPTCDAVQNCYGLGCNSNDRCFDLEPYAQPVPEVVAIDAGCAAAPGASLGLLALLSLARTQLRRRHRL